MAKFSCGVNRNVFGISLNLNRIYIYIRNGKILEKRTNREPNTQNRSSNYSIRCSHSNMERPYHLYRRIRRTEERAETCVLEWRAPMRRNPCKRKMSPNYTNKQSAYRIESKELKINRGRSLSLSLSKETERSGQKRKKKTCRIPSSITGEGFWSRGYD